MSEQKVTEFVTLRTHCQTVFIQKKERIMESTLTQVKHLLDIFGGRALIYRMKKDGSSFRILLNVKQLDFDHIEDRDGNDGPGKLELVLCHAVENGEIKLHVEPPVVGGEVEQIFECIEGSRCFKGCGCPCMIGIGLQEKETQGTGLHCGLRDDLRDFIEDERYQRFKIQSAADTSCMMNLLFHPERFGPKTTATLKGMVERNLKFRDDTLEENHRAKFY